MPVLKGKDAAARRMPGLALVEQHLNLRLLWASKSGVIQQQLWVLAFGVKAGGNVDHWTRHNIRRCFGLDGIGGQWAVLA